jgi:RNA polymerase sigma factor (sigma-70 family)
MAGDEHRTTKGRSDEAFERLYRAHRRAVYHFVLRDLGDPQEAEDVTQMAFLDAYRALARGSRPEEPRPWLFTIARNASRRRFRRPQPDEVPLDEAVPVVDPGAAGAAAREIVAAVLTLSKRHREVLLLRDVRGYSAAEAAGELGTSIASVEMALFRARREVRSALERAGLGPEGRRPISVLAGLLPARLIRLLGSVSALTSAPSLGVVGLGATLVVVLGGASGATVPTASTPVGHTIGPAPVVHISSRTHTHRHRSTLSEFAGPRAGRSAVLAPDDSNAPDAAPSAAPQQGPQAVPAGRPPAREHTSPVPAASGAASVVATLDPPVNLPPVKLPSVSAPQVPALPSAPAVTVPAALPAVP